MAISMPAIISSSRVISLGNIHETHMLKLVSSPEQRKFGDDKRDLLTAQCQRCALSCSVTGAVLRIGLYCPRRRARPELSVCGIGVVFHPHPAGDADDGRTISGRPSTLRSDGIDRGR